jgi:hypothetical protein
MTTRQDSVPPPVPTPRELRRQMLCEHERLHATLTAAIGVEVFTWTHELHHGTPEAVFVADWFSTVAGGAGGAPTCVIHGAEGGRRKKETMRRSIIDLMARLYPGDKGFVGRCFHNFFFSFFFFFFFFFWGFCLRESQIFCQRRHLARPRARHCRCRQHRQGAVPQRLPALPAARKGRRQAVCVMTF